MAADDDKTTGLNTQSVLAMRSAGYYSERTAGARLVIEKALPMVMEALDKGPKLPLLRLADYGSADGGTSRGMWHEVINRLRQAGDDRQIEMLYTDLPSNDFSTLFRMMQGMQGDPALAYQAQHDNVFVHGCGTGFHQQLAADASLSLGFSATAMHYVSEKPCQIAGHVHMVGADPEEQAAFAAQAAADWERILLARAAELAPGGRFICVNFGIDEQGRYLGHTGGVSMFDRFDAHWRALRDNGSITATEYRDASFAQHYRTVEEFRAPLDDPDSAVSRAGLRLVSQSTMLTRCPYRVAFEEQAGAMSASDFAASLLPTMRSWSETVFRTALSEERDAAEAAAIIDSFYGAYEAEVAANPDGHAMDYIHVIMEIEKTAD